MSSVVPLDQPIRLAIVGASVRAAARSALRAGFEVVGADLFADADLDGVCPITKIENYPYGFADWLVAQSVDAWMYTGALENYPDLVDHMATIKPLWGVSGEALRRCRDPLFSAAGAFGKVLFLPDTVSARDAVDPQRRWLAKTYRHSAGVGVWRVRSDADFGRARAEGAFLQEEVDGASMSAVYALGPRRPTLLGVTQQRLGDGDSEFAYRGSIGPLPIAGSLDLALGSLGVWLLGAMKLRGVVGVDLVVQDNRPFVVEINPRYTASVEVLERSQADSAIAAHAACFTAPSGYGWRDQPSGIVGKQIVYATRSIVVPDGFESWALVNGAADRPRPGERIEAGRPVCTVFAKGDNVGDVELALDRTVRDALAWLSS